MSVNSFLKNYRNILNYHGYNFYGFKRVIDQILEVDFFDFSRGHKVHTAFIKTPEYTSDQYMHYQPAYTSVVKEMIQLSVAYYTSISYSDKSRFPIFVDLGCGSGKTLLIAEQFPYFKSIFGIEIDKELSNICEQNLQSLSGNNNFCINANVEEKQAIDELLHFLDDTDIDDITVFAFNKNSYGQKVLESSLNLLKEKFNNIFYLYQNPVFGQVLLDNGFYEILSDSKNSTVHKNYKYKIYHYTKSDHSHELHKNK